jgi:hypothetical protein
MIGNAPGRDLPIVVLTSTNKTGRVVAATLVRL